MKTITLPVGIYSQVDIRIIRNTLEQLWQYEHPNAPQPHVTDEHLLVCALGAYRVELLRELDEVRAARAVARRAQDRLDDMEL